MSPAFRPTRHVGIVVSRDGECVYLARLPDGPLLVLEGVAAAIWAEGTTGPADGWVGRVAEAFDETEARIAADVGRFVADLESQGIIESAGSQS